MSEIDIVGLTNGLWAMLIGLCIGTLLTVLLQKIRTRKIKPGDIIQVTGSIHSGRYKLIMPIPFSLSEIDVVMKDLKAGLLRRREKIASPTESEVAPLLSDKEKKDLEALMLKAAVKRKPQTEDEEREEAMWKQRDIEMEKHDKADAKRRAAAKETPE